MPRPRIAVVSPFVDKRHGTERCLAEQLERLARDYEIHLFSSRVEDTDLGGIRWHRVPDIPGPHLVKYLFWFAANHYCRWNERRRSGRRFELVYSPGINCLDADVVIVHIVFAEFLRQVEQSLRLSRNPVKTWPRILHRRLYYRLIIALERRIYSAGGARLAAVSRKTRDDIERHYGARRPATVVYNGIDPRRFAPHIRKRARAEAREKLGIAPDRFVMLLVGNDFKKKGLTCLLQAAQKMRNPRLLVLVCGQDDPAPFEPYTVGPGAVPTIFLPIRSDVEFYYAAADAYIGPSLEDAFSIPPLEAMAMGLPTVVSRQSGVSEVLTHGRDSLILEDPANADELARLLSLLKDDSLRGPLAANGAATAQGLTWDHNAEQMKRLFEQALAGRAAGRREVASVTRP